MLMRLLVFRTERRQSSDTLVATNVSGDIGAQREEGFEWGQRIDNNDHFLKLEVTGIKGDRTFIMVERYDEIGRVRLDAPLINFTAHQDGVIDKKSRFRIDFKASGIPEDATNATVDVSDLVLIDKANPSARLKFHRGKGQFV